MNRPAWPLGAALSLIVLAALAALAGCSRAAAPSRSKAAEAAAPAPAPAEEAAPAGTKDASDLEGETDDLRSDEAQPGEKKEGPSLSEAPASEAKPWGQEGEEPEDRLRLEEEKFTQAIEPSALSCSGALPRRDAICTLAERICDLAPSQVPGREHEDCTKARASCEKAKRAYAGRCEN